MVDVLGWVRATWTLCSLMHHAQRMVLRVPSLEKASSQQKCAFFQLKVLMCRSLASFQATTGAAGLLLGPLWRTRLRSIRGLRQHLSRSINNRCNAPDVAQLLGTQAFFLEQLRVRADAKVTLADDRGRQGKRFKLLLLYPP